MKFIIPTLFFLLIAFTAKADTIDYWHVYYNKVKFKEYNQYSSKEKLVLKAAGYKAGDVLTVYHYDDTPCDKCGIFLYVGSGAVITAQAKNTGEGKPLTFELKKLMKFKKKNKPLNYKVYYCATEPNQKAPRNKRLLFEIEII